MAVKRPKLAILGVSGRFGIMARGKGQTRGVAHPVRPSGHVLGWPVFLLAGLAVFADQSFFSPPTRAPARKGYPIGYTVLYLYLYLYLGRHLVVKWLPVGYQLVTMWLPCGCHGAVCLGA